MHIEVYNFLYLPVSSTHWYTVFNFGSSDTCLGETFWRMYAILVFWVLFFFSLDHVHQGISTNCGYRSSKDELKSKVMLQDLEPCASQFLSELISLVHNRLNPSKLTESTDNSSAGENDETNKRKEDSCSTSNDPVANLILTLHPLRIHSVFLAMAVSSFLIIVSMNLDYLGSCIINLSFLSFLSTWFYLCFLCISINFQRRCICYSPTE